MRIFLSFFGKNADNKQLNSGDLFSSKDDLKLTANTRLPL